MEPAGNASASSVPRIPSTWENEFRESIPTLENNRQELAKKPKPLVEVLRVNQLDAIKLDQEISEVLKMQFWRIFSFMRPTFTENYEPELNAFLQFLIYRYSIFNLGTTYGNLLQNLKFRNEHAGRKAPQDVLALTSPQKILYGVFTIGGEWLWARINRMSVNGAWGDMDEDTWQRKAWKILTYIENTYRAMVIINFILFLRNGQYVSLVNRILGMRLVYNKANMTRRVSFELLNRQLVWLGFSEFLLFLLPLINMDRIKNYFYRRFTKQHVPDLTNLTAGLTSFSACPICSSEPCYNPYITSCGHIFCYYCLKSNAMSESQNFPCPRCDTKITSMQRWSPNTGVISKPTTTNTTTTTTTTTSRFI